MIGKLSTGYAPLLIQMYATAAFDFDQAANGWLMSEFAFMRSFFLIFIFPPVISWGRSFMQLKRERGGPSPEPQVVESGHAAAAELPTDPAIFDATHGEQAETEPVGPPRPTEDREACHFDLIFLRWSLVVDGALTTVAAFATKPWHIYLGEQTRLGWSGGRVPSTNGGKQRRSCCPLVPAPRRRPRASSLKCAASGSGRMPSTR